MKLKNIPYFIAFYIAIIIGYSVIKHFTGWNSTTFAQLTPTENNFIGAFLTVLVEIVLALIIGFIVVIAGRETVGRFIILATATLVPVVAVAVLAAHFAVVFFNRHIDATNRKELHTEIISRLPKNLFTKKSNKDDFSGYVTADNDSLGIILADSNQLARVYFYIDSNLIGPVKQDSCQAACPALQKRLIAYLLPMQSLNAEETAKNMKLVSDGNCYTVSNHIYLGQCGNQAKRFIIINPVYDKVRHINCYEIGMQVDVKTQPASFLSLF